MKYFLLIFLLVQISFSSELTRKIMVSSFHTQKDADLALTVFNKNKSDKFNDLQEELDFKVISRKSDNFYIISIEAFKDYTEAKLVLNEISKKYPDAYINKYDSKISQAIEEETVEEPKQNIHIITKKLFENIDNEKNENIKIGDSQKQETIKTENTFEEMKMDNKEEESLKFKNIDYSFIYYSDDTILFNVKRNLSIFPLIKDSSIIKVEYKDYTAKRSSDFVNQLLKEYLIQNIEDNSNQLKESIEFIEVQLEKE